jgi:hypothetical protein
MFRREENIQNKVVNNKIAIKNNSYCTYEEQKKVRYINFLFFILNVINSLQ